MLATIAALQLVALTQVAPPREVTPADAMPEEVSPQEATPGIRAPVEVHAPAAVPASTPLARPAPAVAPAEAWGTPPAAAADVPGQALAQENPPLPSKPSPGGGAEAAPAAPRPPPAAEEPPRPAAGTEPVPLPQPPDAPTLPPPDAEPAASTRRPSLLSGEPLRGVSTALAWAGWSSVGIAYGQGITSLDDLGGFADYDWATSELVAGLAYRRYVGRAGGWDLAGRLSAGWYSNLGSTLLDDDNRSDRGIRVAPSLSVSRSGAAGVFSAIVEGPITVTWKYGAGLLFAPRLTVAFEAPVYHDVTVGFRAGAAYRAGAGEAPLKVGAPEFVFVVLAGYHLL